MPTNTKNTNPEKRLSAILFADITEQFTFGEIKGGKCTFDSEVTLAPSKDGQPFRFREIRLI